MGRLHSIFQASNKINHNAKNKLEDDITRRITFSPIISRKRNPPFASSERPTKKKRVRSDSNSNNIKNKHNNQVAASDVFKTSDRTTEELYANKNGILGTAIEQALQRMPLFHNPIDTSEDTTGTVNLEISSPPTNIFHFA
jgi:hypothetical protein